MKISHFQLTRIFLRLTVGILVVFGVGSFLRIIGNADQATLYGFYGLAMFADAAVMLLCAWQLNRRSRFAFYLSFLVLAINIILTFFDQVGWVDILFVLLNLVPLMFLILARKEFLPA
jgi:hypothetical protein